jgi:D-glycero-D-manno-heptose 1,7-bisphosphate phosphatase
VAKALFIDRDDTINVDREFISSPDEIDLIPGAAEAMARARRAGYLLILVTNQSGVARGLLTEEMLERVHDELQRQLSACGAALDGLYYCPHLEGAPVAEYDVRCDCRKPLPGLVLRAAKEHSVDLARSWMIGDRPSDVEAGRAAGCRTAFVRTGRGPSGGIEADLMAGDLAEAIDAILRIEAAGSERGRLRGRDGV